MKKLVLKSNLFSGGEVLSRAQLKKVMGGEDGSGSGGDYGCSVSCAGGKFACCNPGGVAGMPECKCYDTGTILPCKDGGSGATSCSITVA